MRVIKGISFPSPCHAIQPRTLQVLTSLNTRGNPIHPQTKQSKLARDNRSSDIIPSRSNATTAQSCPTQSSAPIRPCLPIFSHTNRNCVKNSLGVVVIVADEMSRVVPYPDFLVASHLVGRRSSLLLAAWGQDLSNHPPSALTWHENRQECYTG